jgi:hypothetical protein
MEDHEKEFSSIKLSISNIISEARVMKQMPCIKNKCIVYPSCRTRQTVNCHYMYGYFRECEINNEKDHSSYAWDDIHKYFPNLTLILPGAIGNTYNQWKEYTHE